MLKLSNLTTLLDALKIGATITFPDNDAIEGDPESGYIEVFSTSGEPCGVWPLSEAGVQDALRDLDQMREDDAVARGDDTDEELDALLEEMEGSGLPFAAELAAYGRAHPEWAVSTGDEFEPELHDNLDPEEGFDGFSGQDRKHYSDVQDRDQYVPFDAATLPEGDLVEPDEEET